MKSFVRGPWSLMVLSLLTLLLSGCYLRALSGNITGDEDGAVGYVRGTAITADCVIDFPGEPEGSVSCFYLIDYEGIGFELVTTFDLIAEFGLFGVLIDPLILHVSEDVTELTGTFTEDSSSDTQQAVITEVDSFKVQPGVEVSAEPGHKFVILEFPGGTDYNEVQYDFELTFRYPVVESVAIKAMFAGRIDAGGETYYIPVLPCRTDFADVPEFTIPVSNTPQDLTQDLAHFWFQNKDIVCDGEVYDFSGITPTPSPSPSPSPSPTPAGQQVAWGDHNCSGSADPVDALLNLRDDAGLPSETNECPEMGATVDIDGTDRTWGDFDCSATADPVDGLKVLRFDAGLSVDRPPSCPDPGETITVTG